ncbi:Guanine nucleotide-binding protein subunit beta-2-like 1 [Linnemannia schmuckeri]|uniref:Guanine nucleotide-binding protein subunit beta-2-like 1 n=1 Tax=Linnemannia schmuckeri TaxID=64567 RepID=A0A9P5RZP3_9FUNG|nr:Guanine nucleotide-binding protein subunit beta-2-like 1 [Linnemannia schmuckeri]
MTVRLWDSRSGAPGRVLSGHIKSISSISISPSEDRIFSGSGDGTIRVWDMNTGESRVIVSPDHDALAEVWDFFIYSYGLGDVEEFIVDFKYSRSCNQIATIHGDENVRLWSEDAGVFQHSLKHDTEVSCFAISSCGQWIACGSGDSVWLWNFVVEDGIQQWKCISKTPDFSFRYVRNIAWRPDNLEFAIGYDDSSIRVWRLQTGSNALSIQLVWSIGPAPLVVAGAVIIDTVGLSDVNRRLLLQRGAIDGSLLKEV